MTTTTTCAHCDQPTHTRGLCRTHYHQQVRDRRDTTRTPIQHAIDTLYADGQPIHRIARTLHTTSDQIIAELRTTTIHDPKKITSRRNDEIINRIADGEAISTVAKDYGISTHTATTLFVTKATIEQRDRRNNAGNTPRVHIIPGAPKPPKVRKPRKITTTPDSDRTRDMARLRLAGHTLQQIADQHGLTRERVRQILEATPDANAAQIEHIKQQRAALKEQDAARAAEEQARSLLDLADRHLATGTPITAEHLAPLDLNPRAALKVLAGHGHPAAGIVTTTTRATGPARTHRFTDDEAFALMRELADGGTLTMADYDRGRDGRGVTGQALIIRHGSWTAACELAGVTPNRSSRVPLIHDETYLRDSLAQFLVDPDQPSKSARNYDRWAIANGRPCCATLRHRLGRTWRELVVETALTLRDQP